MATGKDTIKDFEELVPAISNDTFKPFRIEAIKAVRSLELLTLKDSMIFIAEIFSFKSSDYDDPDIVFEGWRKFWRWQDENQVSLEMVQGPHAVTMLKAIAAKHGRLNVSTGQ